MLALGTELKHATLGEDTTLVRVDIEVAQLHKHHRAHLPVLGDVSRTVRAMLSHPDAASGRVARDWSDSVRDAARRSRSRATEIWSVLHDAVLDGAGRSPERPVVLTGDSSQISWLGTVQTAVLDGPRRFVTTDGYATLGYGLPAAIGATLAVPDSTVVALLGDGALMFSVQELATASELGLSLAVVVLDNGGYAEIEANMRDAGLDPFAVALTPPDYAALAAAFHCRYEEARGPAELAAAVRAASGAGRPSIIRVAQSDFATAAWRPQTRRAS